MSVSGPPPKRRRPVDDCATCRYKEPANGGHCYMFIDPPTAWCQQHQWFDGRGDVVKALLAGDERPKRAAPCPDDPINEMEGKPDVQGS